jgi:hypothetical protein
LGVSKARKVSISSLEETTKLTRKGLGVRAGRGGHPRLKQGLGGWHEWWPVVVYTLHPEAKN